MPLQEFNSTSFEARLVRLRLLTGGEPDVLARFVRRDRAREAAQEAAQEERRIAELEFEVELKSAACGIARLRRQIAEHKAGFNPDQPRIPAGNRGGGRWTSGDGLDAIPGLDELLGFSAGGLFSGLFDGTLADLSGESGGAGSFAEAPDGTPVVPAGVLDDRTVDLDKEEDGPHGGHTLKRHVNVDDEYLKQRLINSRRVFIDPQGNIEIRQIEAAGRFNSRTDADFFVNEAIRLNRPLIEAARTAGLLQLRFDHRFGFRTGREAYSETNRSDPYIRETFAVRIDLELESRGNRDYRLRSAYPILAPRKP